ncbi:Uncharacterized protein DBV15_00614 [Temnothorax longispinosus]|uniref:Uncharacterized protein n=1 Tax=Temnothorax longispinosus TaxID=300112 RepID=A0A4S2KTA4_9HYME|nr:Uncharacterized protein DBV15_00614 [Temnothorax longispinosus]
MRTTGREVSIRHEMEEGGQVGTAGDIVIYDIVEDPEQEKTRSGATRDIARHQLPPTKSY